MYWYWLLAQSASAQFELAARHGGVPTAQAQIDYEARYGDYDQVSDRVMTIAGDVAEIRVSGIITRAPSFMAMLFGGGNVTYPELVAAFSTADQDASVARIEMVVDSPGGEVDGLFEAIAAMQAVSKPIKAIVRNKAASAAYALVAQADEIVALNRAAMVGSIGIVTSVPIYDDVVTITSTGAPKKRPDAATESGRAVIREELDALHQLFAESIASGRDTDVDTVNARYGQGAMLVAADALERGMIDSVAGAPLRVVKSQQPAAAPASATQQDTSVEIKPMDLKTLKAQHPDVYEAAMQEGVTQERDRVSAHLTAGSASGLMEDAIKAVTDGTAMTQAQSTKYLMAAANRGDQQRRAEDERAASAAANGAAAPAAPAQGGGQDVVAMVEQSMGVAK